ncbi:MAG: hypothetical protein WDO06_01590 [Actinomycetota bacterium]
MTTAETSVSNKVATPTYSEAFQSGVREEMKLNEGIFILEQTSSNVVATLRKLKESRKSSVMTA